MPKTRHLQSNPKAPTPIPKTSQVHAVQQAVEEVEDDDQFLNADGTVDFRKRCGLHPMIRCCQTSR
eukprot:3549960-Rhodomonas_salina.1